MELTANTKFALFAVVVLAFCVPSVDAQCTRLKFYGSSINYIHKAHERIHEILQYATVDTVAYYIAVNKKLESDGATYDNHLYYVTNDPKTDIRKLLAVRVATRNGNVTIEDYAMLDVTSVSDPSSATDYSKILGTRFGFDAGFLETAYDAARIGNASYDCRLIKEEFTYFYEMYPSRFQKIIN